MKPDELREIRKSLEMTQAQFAEVLEVQPNTVARWESGVLPISKVVELAVKSLKKESKK